MKVVVMKIELYANWVHSLKEKRMVLNSLKGKLSNKFNISIAEIEKHDLHQRIVIGISFVCTDIGIADATEEKILEFIDLNSEAEVINVESFLENY